MSCMSIPFTPTPRPSSPPCPYRIRMRSGSGSSSRGMCRVRPTRPGDAPSIPRSEEHTSELQSRENLVCRLLPEKKKYLICAPSNQKYIHLVDDFVLL